MTTDVAAACERGIDLIEYYTANETGYDIATEIVAALRDETLRWKVA